MGNVDYRVVSSDSHVIEPHDLWRQRLPVQFRDRAPRLTREEHSDVLLCDDVTMPPVGLLAGCYRADGDQRREGRWDEDVPVAAYDADVRLREIARDGVDAEVLYPTLGMRMFPIEDREYLWALFRAYNEWLAQDFCAVHPDRFFGIAMIDPEDVDLAIAEITRARGLGLVGFMVPMYCGELPYHDSHFDPLWAAAVDLQMPVNLHLTTSRANTSRYGKTLPSLGSMMLGAAGIQTILLDLIAYGLFDRFPELRVVSAENDAGWASHVMEAADYSWHRIYHFEGVKSAEEPSHYFRENIKLTFMRDRAAILGREIIGTEPLMWGNDYPHTVSTWPNSQALLERHLHDQPDEVRNAVVCGNVRALYGF
jgi:predicted TIM-barrel fold metal-dependent hydrolase